MAEKTKKPDPSAEEPDADVSETTEDKPTTGGNVSGGGEYVVIADQVILPGPGGKGHVTHKFGAKVNVPAAHLRRLVGGTRPVLVEASKLKDTGRGALVAALRGEIARAAKDRSKRRGGK